MKGQKTEELFNITIIYATICTQSGSNGDDLSLNVCDMTDVVVFSCTNNSVGAGIVVVSNDIPHVERTLTRSKMVGSIYKLDIPR